MRITLSDVHETGTLPDGSVEYSGQLHVSGKCLWLSEDCTVSFRAAQGRLRVVADEANRCFTDYRSYLASDERCKITYTERLIEIDVKNTRLLGDVKLTFHRIAPSPPY